MTKINNELLKNIAYGKNTDWTGAKPFDDSVYDGWHVTWRDTLRKAQRQHDREMKRMVDLCRFFAQNILCPCGRKYCKECLICDNDT